MTPQSSSEPSAGAPLRAAVLGSPISHSKSPQLHRAAYRRAGLPWRYDAIEVKESELAAFLSALGQRWVGLSLTMPLKEVVLGLVDDLDASAARTNAANTVVLPGSPQYPGQVVGYNTDVQGIVEAVRSHGQRGIESVEILGSGATARSALAAAADLGAHKAIIRARNAQAARDLAELAKPWGFDEVQVAVLSDAPVGESDLTVSTLPPGAADALTGQLGAECGVLLDVVYEPWPTTLAKAWPGDVIPGLEMLVCQAAEQIRLMAGVEPDVAAMRAAVSG